MNSMGVASVCPALDLTNQDNPLQWRLTFETVSGREDMVWGSQNLIPHH